MEKEPRDRKINKILVELSECREDERNVQSRILEVITIVGTILGILFGSTFLNPDKLNIPILKVNDIIWIKNALLIDALQVIARNLTYIRIVFLLCLLVFCTAFTHIITLGIGNILRYHYIQNLEERLYTLTEESDDDMGRGKFLYWNEYISPITTQNFKHISSIHGVLHLTCYLTSIFCVILFSLGILITLFLQINPKKQFDYIVILITAIGMMLSFFVFLRLNVKSKDVSQLAWDTAHDNQKIRLKKEKGELYQEAKFFRKTLKYIIYPKRQDLQKPLLIVVGYICGVFLSGQKMRFLSLVNLFFCWFVFDFLAYQARYQINDIRGLDEDEEAGLNNRLISKGISNPGYIIRISRIVVIVRISAAILLTWLCKEQNHIVLMISLWILTLATIAYEFSRQKGWKLGIYVWVGVGYPLRFMIGYYSVVMFDMKALSNAETAVLCFSLWAYGAMASIIAWVNEVTTRMQKCREKNGTFPNIYKKKHYVALQQTISRRYIIAEDCPISGKVLPLRQRGKIMDVWNIFYGLSLMSTILLIHISNKGILNFFYIIMEIAGFGIILLSVYTKKTVKLIMILIGDIWLILSEIVTGVICYDTSAVKLGVIVGLQLLIMFTYLMLSYRPQTYSKFTKQELIKKWNILNCIIWGNKAMDIIKKEQKKTEN